METNIIKEAQLSDTLMHMLGEKVYAWIIDEPGGSYITDGKLLLVSPKYNAWTFYVHNDSRSLYASFSFTAKDVEQIVHNVVFIKS
jgi:hypothetical protein